MMKTASPSEAFAIDVIQFEDIKASQSDGDGFFRRSLYAIVKVFLMVMSLTGMNARCLCQHVVKR
jgi:hypothetical protein